MMRKLNCLVAVISLILTYPAFASFNQCNAILDAELFNNSTSSSSFSIVNAIKLKACTNSYNEFKKSNGFEAAASYSIFDADVKTSSSKFQLWKSKSCSNFSSEHATSKYVFEAQRTLATGVVENWRKCMLDSIGLSCYFEPNVENGSKSIFVVNWKVDSSRKAVIRYWQTDNVDVDTKSIFKKGDIFPQGTDRVLVKSNDQTKVSNIAIGVLQDGEHKYACSAIMPNAIDVDSVDNDNLPLWKRNSLTMIDAARSMYRDMAIVSKTSWVQKNEANKAEGKGYFYQSYEFNCDPIKRIVKEGLLKEKAFREQIMNQPDTISEKMKSDGLEGAGNFAEQASFDFKKATEMQCIK